jgi:hypothetical protein
MIDHMGFTTGIKYQLATGVSEKKRCHSDSLTPQLTGA